ncbi:MAG: DSBA oxidoreductase [Parcubacteria group bacterium GW2011_GWA2_47_9]|nr:MAG: DSBA oxidoreductase [Parcubacteria group bacterium GW2011_GWA2_47_9]
MATPFYLAVVDNIPLITFYKLLYNNYAKFMKIEQFGIFIPIVVALVVAGGIFIWSLSYTPKGAGKLGPKEEKLFLPQANDPFLGSSDAPVTVVEVADILCPGCKRFFDEEEPKLREQYINTGKVKFYFWDVVFGGERSQLASESIYCANDQNKYWEYRELLLSQPRKQVWEWAGFGKEEFVAFARQLGLNPDDFSSCVDSRKYKEFVTGKDEMARGAGVMASPTIFINGKLFTDSSFESMSEFIDLLVP